MHGKKGKKSGSLEDRFNIPTSCACCKKCWMDKYGNCLYGGPFTGYYWVDENDKFSD